MHAFARGYQGYKSNFGFRVPFDRETCSANLVLKALCWICRKEHTLTFLPPDWLFCCNTITFQKYFWCSRFSWFDCKTSDFLMMIQKKILGRIELFETLTIFFHVLVFAFFNFCARCQRWLHSNLALWNRSMELTLRITVKVECLLHGRR